ncbi:MAG: glycosyltransferase family 4 protein [Acidimicrobiales bacterium]
MRVVLTYAGLRPGGVTADVRNLEQGLRERDVDVVVAGGLGEVGRHVRAAECVVHVFASMPSMTTYGSLLWGRACGRPLVWTPVFHPSRPRSWVGYGPGRAMEAFDRVAPQAARLVNGVIAATDAEADFFRHLGTPLVETIAPAVASTSRALTGDARRDARASFGLGDEPVVLVVARAANARRKGLAYARDVFCELRRRVPAARLLLLGYESDGPLVDEPGAVATGWVGPDRAGAAYGCADVLLVSSIYEGLPRAVVEAWSHELPAVVTDRVALAPLVRTGAGEVVAFGDVDGGADALERVVTDADRARAYGAKGRALVEGGFLLADHVERTMSMYQDVSAMIKTGKGAGRDHRRE